MVRCMYIHRSDHSQVGTGKRAVGETQHTILAIDGAPCENELGGVGASHRHRVGDEEYASWPTLAHRVADHRRMDVNAIGNKPRIDRADIERRRRRPARGCPSGSAR